MKHPPYPLRPNKTVDRFMLVETINRLCGHADELKQYTYYGFGGPYLEDFRLLYEHFPEMKMISFEKYKETYKQQKFHLPCNKIVPRRGDFSDFLAQYEPNDEKPIFWLDYTDLAYSEFADFQGLLIKVPIGSIIKITLRSQAEDYIDEQKCEDFRAEFLEFLPDPSVIPPRRLGVFSNLLQTMVHIAAQKVLPDAAGLVFQPTSSFCYADSVGIFTLTGVKCDKTERRRVCSVLKKWKFANLNWGKPKLIDVPFLSTKERLHLQKHLPCRSNAGRRLSNKLGYLIDDDRRLSTNKMKQYAEFYRYYPYFVRAIP